MGEEILTLEEQKQILIDAYINLMRIKRVQKEVNEELEYQIKTTIPAKRNARRGFLFISMK